MVAAVCTIIDECESDRDVKMLRDVGRVFGYSARIIQNLAQLKWNLKFDLTLFANRECGIRGNFLSVREFCSYIIEIFYFRVVEDHSDVLPACNRVL